MPMSNSEKESMRRWLYEHNGAQGPDPITKGAGGLGGLWGAVERILAAHTAAAVQCGRVEALRVAANEIPWSQSKEWLRDRADREASK